MSSLNRRQFVRVAGAFLATPYVLGDSIIAPVEASVPIDYMTNKEVFDLVFETHIWQTGENCRSEIIKYPLNLLAPNEGIKNDEYLSHQVNYSYEIDRYVGGDYLILHPHKFKSEEAITQGGIDCLVASAIDRNVIAYDKDAKEGELSKRLISLMKTVYSRTNGYKDRMNILLVDKQITKIGGVKIEKDTTCFGVKIIRCDIFDNEFLREIGDIGMPEGKKSMVVGLNLKANTFINEEINGKNAIAVLDNKQVLMGAV